MFHSTGDTKAPYLFPEDVELRIIELVAEIVAEKALDLEVERGELEFFDGTRELADLVLAIAVGLVDLHGAGECSRKAADHLAKVVVQHAVHVRVVQHRLSDAGVLHQRKHLLGLEAFREVRREHLQVVVPAVARPLHAPYLP